MTKSALQRFFSNDCTATERQEVIHWLLNPANDFQIKTWMKENWDFFSRVDFAGRPDNPDVEMLWQRIRQQIQPHAETAVPVHSVQKANFFSRFRLKHYAAAAAVIIMLAAGAFYLLQQKSGGREVVKAVVQPRQNDIKPPVENKAVLTLADGRKIVLDSSGNGTLAQQGDVKIVKGAAGEISYNGTASGETSYNTLSVPKGSKPTRLVLADGSLVWLNAASSVTFPTAFVGAVRKVSITGEAYFEVAKNAALPFYVSYEDVTVKVLGTHFNVNTDAAETKVTLLEGSVQVLSRDRIKVLKPGQQAQVTENTMKVESDVNLEEVMAWKNGQFYFSGTDIKTVMRQIGNYYNVDVEYRDAIPYLFVAKISRGVNVSEFLKILELTNLVHFKIEKNKIIVTK